MSITEHELEERAVGTRVTLAAVESNILFEYYFSAGDGVREASKTSSPMAGYAKPLDQLTFCVLVLKNGFTVTGQSACADPKNFQKDIGERIAREDAVRKIWPLLGYALRTHLHAQAHAQGE